MKSLSSVLALALLIPAAVSAQTFVQNFQAKAKKTSDAIKNSGLNADLKGSFEARFLKINESVCGRGIMIERFIESPSATTCPGISASKVEDANDSLDTLNDDLADAIKKDGSKNEAQLYAPKLAVLKQKVQNSKIDKNDQKALLDRIDNFDKSDAPKGMPALAGTKGSKEAGKLDEKFQKLSDDIDAAIDLAKDNADAAGFAKAFTTKADALKTKISGSKLAAPIQQDFQNQLAALRKAACEPAAGAAGAKRPGAGLAAGVAEKAGKDVCRGTPSTIEKGDDALTTLSDGVDAAIKADGTKSLTDIYKPQLAALKANLAAARVDTTDLNALNKRIDDFAKSLQDIKNNVLAGRPGVQGKKPEDVVQTAADTYQKLSDDVAAAVALAKTDKGGDFYAELQKQLTALDAKVKATKLDPAFKSDFDARAARIVADVCPTAAGRKGFDMKGCDKAAPSKISAAQTALDKLSDDVDAAVKSDGTETLAAVYKPKLAALTALLKASTVSAENQKPLLKRLDSFDKDILSKSEAGARKKKAGEDEVQKASDLYNALASDVAAAIKLSPMNKVEADMLNVKVVALAATIAGNGTLDAKTKADFAQRASTLESQLKGSPKPNPDDANDAYNALSNDYQTALKTAASAKTPSTPLQ